MTMGMLLIMLLGIVGVTSTVGIAGMLSANRYQTPAIKAKKKKLSIS